MRPGVTVVLAAALAALAGCRTRADIQRDYARTLAPAPLRAPLTDPDRPVRAYPVRILLGDDYAAETLTARERIAAQLSRANALLEAQFRIRLEVTEVREWKRRAGSRSIYEALDALAAEDAAEDVAWVIGFLGSTGEAGSGAPDQLGAARVFGKHLVLRKMGSVEERSTIDGALDALSVKERADLLRDRQLHQETTVLLHEWAHTLGGPHDGKGEWIMSAVHDSRISAFSPESVRVLAIGLAHLQSRDPGRFLSWAQAYREEAERGRGTAWDQATYAEMVALAARVEASPPPVAREPRKPAASPAAGPSAGKEGAGEGTGEPPSTAAADGALLAHVEANLRLGDSTRAWATLAPLLARRGDLLWLRVYACDVGRAGAPGEPAAKGACRAAEKLPGNTSRERPFAYGRALLALGDEARAARWLVAAEGADPKGWAALSLLLSSERLCTAAERAAEHAAGERSVASARASCAQLRKRALLPVGQPGVPIDREGAYVERALVVRTHAQAGKVNEARKAAQELEAEFPGTPAGPFFRCLAEAAGGSRSGLRAACAEAEKRVPAAHEPPYALGMLAGTEGHWPEARAALERSLAREPADPALWARLGHALGKVGDARALAELERRHRERFGTPLRPSW
jgi:tetratricopeptide (TPR) repeat protein